MATDGAAVAKLSHCESVYLVPAIALSRTLGPFFRLIFVRRFKRLSTLPCRLIALPVRPQGTTGGTGGRYYGRSRVANGPEVPQHRPSTPSRRRMAGRRQGVF